jgi:hypothetical protein
MELVFEMRELEAAGDSAAGEITVSGPVPTEKTCSRMRASFPQDMNISRAELLPCDPQQ